jgi:hypothetical protein
MLVSSSTLICFSRQEQSFIYLPETCYCNIDTSSFIRILIKRSILDLYCFGGISYSLLLQAARMAGWLPDSNEKKFPKTSHVGFGLVLGADGKRFRTRSTEVVRLGDLLDEAKARSKSELKQRLTDNGKWYNDGISFASFNNFS